MYKTITMAVAVLALAGSGAAFAQTTTATSSNTQQHMSKSGWHAKHMQSMQTRLAKLKAQLKITSSQESAWNGFAQAAENMWPSATHSTMKQKSMNRTAPEVFKDMAQRAQQRAQKSAELSKAADNLYSKLSSGQKTTWNKSIEDMHAKMHHHMMHKMDKAHGMHGSVGGQG